MDPVEPFNTQTNDTKSLDLRETLSFIQSSLARAASSL